MTSDTAQPDLRHGDEHGPTLGPRQYVFIGVLLTVITAIELWVSYAEGLLGDLMVPILIVLSALKFAIVVAFFMHLRFDSPLLTRLFVFGLALAGSLLIALIAIFWTDDSGIAGAGEAPGQVEEAAPEGAETARVELRDFSVQAPASVAAGPVRFEIQNAGAAPHNLRVILSDAPLDGLPMTGGGTVDEGQVDVVAQSEDIAPSASGQVDAELAPGRYLLICNVPGHYQLGMVTELTVE